MSAGRQMVGHFSNTLVDENGAWLDQTLTKIMFRMFLQLEHKCPD